MRKAESNFQKLQRAMGKRVTSGFAYEVFDLIYLDGFHLTETPLKHRKEPLKAVVRSNNRDVVLRYSEHIQGSGDEFFKHACEYGVGGIVSKLADSPYESTRNRNWLKVKCAKQQEFVIAGYTPSSKDLPGFASLVLGFYEKGLLVYAGPRSGNLAIWNLQLWRLAALIPDNQHLRRLSQREVAQV